MSERVEIRDGKEFRVTVLPDAEPKRKKKPVMSKRMAKGLAIGKKSSQPKRGFLCSRCKKPLRGPGHIVRRNRRGKLYAICRSCWNPEGKQKP